MTGKSNHPILLLPAALLLSLTGAVAQPMTWLEHREAAAAQLGYQLADPVTPVEHLERALELARGQGASPSDIGDLMDRLAQAYAVEDNARSRQEVILLEALRYKESNLGQYAPELVSTLSQLSDIRFYQQRHLESLQLMARALNIRIRNFGAQSPQAAEGYVLLGSTFLAVGDDEQAEPLLRKAVEIVRTVPDPPDDIFTLALSNLSEFLRGRGNLEEAEALQKEMVPAFKRQAEKDAREATLFEKLPRVPSLPDVEYLTEDEVAAAVAAGLATVDPAPPAP